MTMNLVIGLGNDDRGDDGVGLMAARRVRAAKLPRVAVVEMSLDPAKLMDLWGHAQRVYIVDCSAPAGRPGTIRRFAAEDGPLPALFGTFSSHLLGIEAIIELARAMHCLPYRLTVYAIEGGSFLFQSQPQRIVAKAADEVALDICKDLSGHSDTGDAFHNEWAP